MCTFNTVVKSDVPGYFTHATFIFQIYVAINLIKLTLAIRNTKFHHHCHKADHFTHSTATTIIGIKY